MSKSTIFIPLIEACKSSNNKFFPFGFCIKDPEKYFSSKGLSKEFNSLSEREKDIFRSREKFFDLLVEYQYITKSSIVFNTTSCCEICGGRTEFLSISRGYKRICSPECSSKLRSNTYQNYSEEQKQARRDNISKGLLKRTKEQNKISLEKRRSSLKTRTGYENNSQNPENKKKVRATWDKKSSEEIEIINSSIKSTKFERYRDSNYNNKEKIKRTVNSWSEEKREEVSRNRSLGQLNRSKESIESSIKKSRGTLKSKLGVVSYSQRDIANIEDLYLNYEENCDEINIDFILKNFCDIEKREIYKDKVLEYFNLKTGLIYWRKIIPSLKREGFLFKSKNSNKTNNNISLVEDKCLTETELRLGRELNRQKIIKVSKKSRFKVDGYDSQTNTVYEFLGDFWHGNLEIFESKSLNKRNKTSYGELNERTYKRLEALKKLGNRVKYIWERDYYSKGIEGCEEL